MIVFCQEATSLYNTSLMLSPDRNPNRNEPVSYARFLRREILLLPQGEVRTLQAIPMVERGQALLLPGLGHGINEMSPVIHALVTRGIAVACSEHDEQNMQYAPQSVREAQREAEVAASVMQATEMPAPTTIIAHSKAIEEAFLLADAGLASRLFLISPGYLHQRHGVRHLLGRATRSAWETVSDSSNHIATVKPFWATARTAKNNVWAFGRRIHQIATTPLVDQMSELVTRGVDITILHGIYDRTFPIEEVEASARAAGVSEDNFISVPGNHDMHLRHPDALMGFIADRIISAATAPSTE